MPSTISKHTIDALRSVFACFGLPEQLVSDNGPQLSSDEFSQFMQSSGIEHILGSPYHPSLNGLAERFVRTFKRAMRADEKHEPSITRRLSEFLFSYRSTLHATTNTSPGELFLQRKLRTHLDLLKTNHDKRSKLWSLTVGSSVMVRDFHHHNKWIPGTIVEQLRPLTYHVDVGEGKILKRHIDHLTEQLEPSPEVATTTHGDLTAGDEFHYPTGEQPLPDPAVLNPPPQGHRYPQRVHHPPDRLTMTVGENC